MMNVFCGEQAPSKVALHHNAMFELVRLWGGQDVYIAILDVPTALQIRAVFAATIKATAPT